MPFFNFRTLFKHNGTKPTLLVIPGAWHSSACFNGLNSKLRAQGFEVVALTLPSVGEGNDTCTTDEDAAFIQQTTAKLVEEGKEIMLVMHSYGGIPGTQSAKGLLKKDRKAEGKKGGIVGLFYISAFVLREGESVAAACGQLPDWIKMDGPQLYVPDGPHIFYNDLPAPAANAWASKLQRHAASSFLTNLTYAAYKHVPSTFMFCEADNATPLALQTRMIDTADEIMRENGHKFSRVSVASSHSPFLSMPGTVAEEIKRMAEEVVE